jgi:hypothetical protein
MVIFDQVSGRFDVEVFPDPGELGESPGGDPVREAIVSLRSRSSALVSSTTH